MSPDVRLGLACFALAVLASVSKQLVERAVRPVVFPAAFTRRDRALHFIGSAANAGFTALFNSLWVYQLPQFGPARTIAVAIGVGLGWTEILNAVRNLILRSLQGPGGADGPAG